MTNSNLQHIENRLMEIRHHKVLIDRDVAALYGVETRDVNKAVKNNPDKFPSGYIIELNDKEKVELVENFHHLQPLKFAKTNPKAFTEKGLYMLATILKSKQVLIDGDFDPVRESHRPKLSHQSSGCTEATERTLSLSKCVEVAKRPLRRK